MLTLAAKQVADAVQRLAQEYKLKNFTLIGGGGGCGALVPAVADRLHVPFHLAEHAEVISSIGVALALVREEVERGISASTPAEVAREAVDRAVAAGADPESVRVITEVIPERATIRAIASGALALDSRDQDAAALSDDELHQIAARRVEVEPDQLEAVAVTGRFHVFRAVPKRGLFRRGWAGVIVIDSGGAIRLTAKNATVHSGTHTDAQQALSQHDHDGTLPRVTLIDPRRLIHLPETNDAAALHSNADSALADAGTPIVAIFEPVSWL